MTKLTHLSLFSGIGGLDLAAEWAGFQTIGQVEKNDYCRAVLEKHWPGIPRWNDITDVSSDALRRAGIEQPPTVLSGGFPCQPFSCAGQRKGTEDDRYLWPEMFRVVQELRPAWVVGENVAGFVSMALDTTCSDLERAGYTCRAFVFPADAVGADHKRYRCFIVARSCDSDSEDERCERIGIPVQQGRSFKADDNSCRMGSSARVSTDANDGIEEGGWEVARDRREFKPIKKLRDWSGTPEPSILGDGNGVPDRVDRITALGNAVVPQQAYPIFRAIAEIEGAVA